MHMTTVFKLMFVFIGFYLVLGGLLNWPWARYFPNAQAIMKRMGSPAARIAVIILGLALAVMGTLGLLGIIPME